MSEALQNLRITQELEGKLANGQPIKGFHGTSAANAQRIEESGFQDHTCVEGDTGVWFWDADVAPNAAYNGQQKARKIGDNKYAVIEAELTRPQPDRKGRKQWLASSSDARVTNVTYHDLE